MKVIENSKTALIGGGINVLSAGKFGSQCGGIIGAGFGALCGLAATEGMIAVPFLLGAGPLLSVTVAGVAGFYAGAAILGAGTAGTAIVANVTYATASAIYS
jgi:hypothetical protein